MSDEKNNVKVTETDEKQSTAAKNADMKPAEKQEKQTETKNEKAGADQTPVVGEAASLEQMADNSLAAIAAALETDAGQALVESAVNKALATALSSPETVQAIRQAAIDAKEAEEQEAAKAADKAASERRQAEKAKEKAAAKRQAKALKECKSALEVATTAPAIDLKAAAEDPDKHGFEGKIRFECGGRFLIGQDVDVTSADFERSGARSVYTKPIQFQTNGEAGVATRAWLVTDEGASSEKLASLPIGHGRSLPARHLAFS